MVKILLNSLIFSLALGVLGYLFWLNAQRQYHCDASLKKICKMAQTQSCQDQPISIWIRVRSNCPFCSSMLPEIGNLQFNSKVYLVGSESRQVLQSWLNFYIDSPDIVLIGSIPKDQLDQVFCSPVVPVTLQFQNSQLIRRYEGYTSLSKWEADL